MPDTPTETRLPQGTQFQGKAEKIEGAFYFSYLFRDEKRNCDVGEKMRIGDIESVEPGFMINILKNWQEDIDCKCNLDLQSK